MDPDPGVPKTIRIKIADPDPDPGGQKLPKKIEKRTVFSCFEVLDVLF
jgi:hypothetical protein